MNEVTTVIKNSATREQVGNAFLEGERFLLTTHEGPDGDALGSLLGLKHLLDGLGKDAVMFVAAKEFPLPIEYRFLPLAEVFHEVPADYADRTLVFLDCGNADRASAEITAVADNLTINIDHHHDNTRFGDVNHVDAAASSTVEATSSKGSTSGSVRTYVVTRTRPGRARAR